MSDHATRRRFIVSTGALATVALAGCMDSGGGSDGDDGEMTDDGDGMGESSMADGETMEGNTTESSMSG